MPEASNLSLILYIKCNVTSISTFVFERCEYPET